MKLISVLILVLSLSSCGYNKALRSVIMDLESTPKCDSEHVLLSPQDTKRTLTGKVIVLNGKLDCHADSDKIIQKKLDSYKKL